MKKQSLCFSILMCIILAGIPLGHAADNKTGSTKKTSEERIVTTEHRLKINGKTINYTASAGRMNIAVDDGEQQARIFFMAYEQKTKAGSPRPITFAFNGGPGSSSVWLHFGAMGPRRILLSNNGAPLPPPAQIIDNAYTWLAFTDLVFIDPVGTGYSRAQGEKKEKPYYDFKKDIETVGEFIRRYLSRYNRWASPIFLVGESYGTTRAAGLTKHLQQRHGITLNGVLLISPVLDFSTILFHPSNHLPYVLFLPTYTAAAWYHNTLPKKEPSLATALQNTENWAMQHYLPGLALGTALDSQKKQEAAAQLSSCTGIAEDYIIKNRLSVPVFRFRKELLRNKRKIIGRMDARLTGTDTDIAGESTSYDPSLDSLTGPFASAANHYIKNDLQFDSTLPYEYLNPQVSRQWTWRSGLHGGQGYINVAPALTDAMHVNKHLNVFIASGYYDLATPYFAVTYTLNHLELEEQLRDNITTCFYPSGHMMYIDLPSLKKLTKDVAGFYKKTLAQ